MLTMTLALAFSAAAPSLPSAEIGGYFEFEEPWSQHTIIAASGGGGHSLHFVAPELSGEVGCGSTLEGTAESNTTEDIRLSAAFTNCTVTSTGAKAPIDSNGCWFTFKMAKAPVDVAEQTVQLTCPVGQKLRITRSDCTIALPPQTFTGVTYGQATNWGKPALTVSFDSKLVFEYEGGICAFLGTSQTGTLKGSQTLKGWRTDGEPAKVDVEWDDSLGHFVSAVEHPTITGTENAEHHLDFIAESIGGEIGCKKSTYSLTGSSETAQVTAVAPTVSECSTTATGAAVGVGFNGCSYRFDAVAGTTSETEQKIDLVCPTATGVQILDLQSCAIEIPAQSDIGKITYTTVEEGGDHAITLDVNAEFTIHAVNGPCTMLGTTQTGTLKGSVLVKAFDTAGEQVDLTAT